MKEIKKEGNNLVWKIGILTQKSYCKCGARVKLTQYKKKCFCAECGSELVYWDPESVSE